MKCKKCGNDKCIKNGIEKNGEQSYRCVKCGYHFTRATKRRLLQKEIDDIVKESESSEKSLKAIAMAHDISKRTLQRYREQFYKNGEKNRQ